MVTFLLTLIYAVTALFRVIEIYFNDGKFLLEKVCKYALCVCYDYNNSFQDKRKKPRHAFSVVAYLIAWQVIYLQLYMYCAGIICKVAKYRVG